MGIARTDADGFLLVFIARSFPVGMDLHEPKGTLVHLKCQEKFLDKIKTAYNSIHNAANLLILNIFPVGVDVQK